MGKYGIGFNYRGGFTTFPGVFTSIDASALDARPVSPLGVVAILAEGAGFYEPGKAQSLPLGLGSPELFISPSPLLTCALLAAKPFSQLDRGAGQVIVVPVNASTPATKVLTSSAPANLATVTTKGWGLRFNAVLLKHETGKLTIKLPSSRGDIIEVFAYSTVAQLVADLNERSAILKATFTAEGTVANFAETAMTGGTEPAAITADWAAALRALDGIRVNTVHVASSSSTVWAMLADYAIQKRLRGFVGSELKNWNGVSNRAASIATLKSEAAALNAIRMMHCGLGANGLPGYLFAARYAALAATLEPSVPMAYKFLDIEAIEARLDIATEVGGVDGLLMAGVSPPVPHPKAPETYIVGRGLSTWIGDDNMYRREHSILAGVDAFTDLAEAAVDPLLGGEATRASGERAVAALAQVSEACTKPTSVVRINGYRPESIVANIQDTVMNLAEAIDPVKPINFIPLNLKLERTDISVKFEAPLTA